MGVSLNCAVFLSDKDLKGNMGIHEKECQTSIQQEQHQVIGLKQLSVQQRDQGEDKDHQEEQKQQHNNIIVAVPVAPSSYVGSENDESNDGFKTPTSSDHKIPRILECPGAPRVPATKRKACHRRIVRNRSKEFESLFPTPLDLGDGGENKKVKQCSLS